MIVPSVMLLLASWATAVCALALPPSRRDLLIKEEFRPPIDWEIHDNAPADHILNLRIGLVQSNFAELERHLYEVSDPQHPRYGEHLSKDEVEALVAPHPESLELVYDWLASYGFASNDFRHSAAKDWIILDITVAQAEDLLDTVRGGVSLIMCNVSQRRCVRTTTCGSTLTVTISSFGRLAGAFRPTCMRT